MWWLLSSKVRVLCLLAGLLPALSACGFTPIYATNGPQAVSTAHLLQRIEITSSGDRYGELLKARIEDHFDPESISVAPRYRLAPSLRTKAEPFIIESDGTASRFTISLISRYKLTRLSDNKLLHRGVIRRKVSYNVSEDDDYSTVIAQNDAMQRGIVELAEDYKMRISARLAAAIADSGQ